MQLRVLFFGLLKDIAGRAADEREFPDGTTLGAVFDHYARQFPRLLDHRDSTVMARNEEFSEPSEKLSEGDEVAFLPPVSGGSTPYYSHEVTRGEGHFFALTRSPIDVPAMKARLLRGRDGALVVFEGAVRDNTKGRPTQALEYECYEGMAVKMMARIGEEIAAEHEIDRIAMVHRLGHMEVGETSVVIAVSAPHRKPAFAAALEGINRLKKIVPIWKKEFFEDGEVWVEGDWDDSVLKK